MLWSRLAVSDPSRVKADSTKVNLTPCELDLPPTCERAKRAHYAGALLTPAVFGVSSSSGFRRRNVEIWGLSAANVTPFDQIDLYPVKRLILRAQIEHQSFLMLVAAKVEVREIRDF